MGTTFWCLRVGQMAGLHGTCLIWGLWSLPKPLVNETRTFMKCTKVETHLLVGCLALGWHRWDSTHSPGWIPLLSLGPTQGREATSDVSASHLPPHTSCSQRWLWASQTLCPRVSSSNNHLYQQLMSPGRGERQAINDLADCLSATQMEKWEEEREGEGEKRSK